MKSNPSLLIALLLFTVTATSGCEVIGDIFQAGMWTMFIIIILVVALIFWIIRKFRK
jgi:heme/copper-type cytochrome/quinol oxidase subunit 2